MIKELQENGAGPEEEKSASEGTTRGTSISKKGHRRVRWQRLELPPQRLCGHVVALEERSTRTMKRPKLSAEEDFVNIRIKIRNDQRPAIILATQLELRRSDDFEVSSIGRVGTVKIGRILVLVEVVQAVMRHPRSGSPASPRPHLKIALHPQATITRREL